MAELWDNGHNARSCVDHTIDNNNLIVRPSRTKFCGNSNGVMLFGVRLMPSESSVISRRESPSSSSFSSSRKCMSMNNLNQYEKQHQIQGQNCHFPTGDVGVGIDYVSDDTLHGSGGRNRERKRGKPWTEEEHRQFLTGLNEVGKGDWRGISRNFVKTRTPTQVASHAQKYFLRRNSIKRRRRRFSLFDITTDTMNHSLSVDQLNNLDTTSQPKLPISIDTTFSSPCPSKTDTTKEGEFEPFLSLALAQSPSNEESSRPSNTFGGFDGNGDSIISVA